MTKFIKLHSYGLEFMLNIYDISYFYRGYGDEKTTIYLRQIDIHQNKEYGYLESNMFSIKSNEKPEEIMKLIKEANND